MKRCCNDIRRHGQNLSGAFNHLSSKEEYYTWRVDTTYMLVKEYLQKFPKHPYKERICTFAVARKKKKIRYLLKYRAIAPKVARFEICLKYTPAWVFGILLKLLQGR